MCGIVGIISSKVLDITHQNQFKKLLVMDQIRGKDSVGIISQQHAGIQFEKNVIDPVSFLEHRRVTPLLTGAKALVGHNRAATRGGVSVNNAHPFQHGAITLVHNGTLRSNAVTQPWFQVDSESIAYALSLKEPSQAHEVLASLEGAFALIWFDSRDQSWNVAKNDERPLHAVKNTDDTCYWFSSDAGILYAGIHEDMEIVPSQHIFKMPVNQHWKITTTGLGLEAKLVKEVTPFEPKKFYTPKTTALTTVGNTNNHGGGKQNQVSTTTNNTGRYSSYERAQDLFLRAIGKAGWYECEVDKISKSVLGKASITAWVNDDPFCQVQVYNAIVGDLSVGDTIKVWLSTIFIDSYNNRKAIKDNQLDQLTLTSGQWERVPPKEKEPVLCSGCSGIFVEDECTLTTEGDYICKGCMNDPIIREYFKEQLQ